MNIKSIKAKFFRNYQNLYLEIEKKFNIIISPNGMGKTNLLEMIYYFSHLRSFRSALDKELIKRGEKFFYLESVFEDKSGTNTIKIQYENKKNIFFNGRKINKHSDILGKLLTVYFGNEDIYIINGNPLIKRKFFDIFFSILDKEYLFALIKYNSIIKQKNIVLKNKDYSLISVYNKQLVDLILIIQSKRNNYIKKIDTIFNDYFTKIGNFNDKSKIIYNPSIKIENKNERDKIYNILESNIDKEIEIGYSITGSHRDNYLFLLNGIPFNKYASFGQTRLASLILKLTQATLYREKYEMCPILLLDDVILELDEERQKKFLNFISLFNQIFITVTDKKFFSLIEKKDIIKEIELDYGKIK